MNRTEEQDFSLRAMAARPGGPRRIRPFLVLVGLTIAFLLAGIVAGQYRGSWEGDRRGVPDWEVDPGFEHDVFTFARVEYSSSWTDWGGGGGRRRGGRGRRGWGGGAWDTDFPDSDLNFSFRLQQLTSLKVDPDPRDNVVRLTDDELFDYPFIYILEPGRGMYFEPGEVTALRRYLLNGGFLLVDDFWGDYQWEDFHREIKKVFPDREPEDVPADHEIFRCVYELDKKDLQVPAYNPWGDPSDITWEPGHGPNTKELHFRAIYDDEGRMMVFICHNTDLGDGWEREGEAEWYFREFSEKKAYPMGINIVVYAMTH